MKNRGQRALTQMGKNMLLAVMHFNSGFIKCRADQTSYVVSVTFVVPRALIIVPVLGILLSRHAFQNDSLLANQAELPFHFHTIFQSDNRLCLSCFSVTLR